eukprot:3422475-Prymnesium_polylepis.1
MAAQAKPIHTLAWSRPPSTACVAHAVQRRRQDTPRAARVPGRGGAARKQILQAGRLHDVRVCVRQPVLHQRRKAPQEVRRREGGFGHIFWGVECAQQ